MCVYMNDDITLSLYVCVCGCRGGGGWRGLALGATCGWGMLNVHVSGMQALVALS